MAALQLLDLAVDITVDETTLWLLATVQAAAMFCLAALLPALLCTSCFAPDSPRFLLQRGRGTAAVDSLQVQTVVKDFTRYMMTLLQWLRGHHSDLAGEFAALSDQLAAAAGSVLHCSSLLLSVLNRSHGVVASVRERAVLVPVGAGILLLTTASLVPVHRFPISGRVIAACIHLLFPVSRCCW